MRSGWPGSSGYMTAGSPRRTCWPLRQPPRSMPMAASPPHVHRSNRCSEQCSKRCPRSLLPRPLLRLSPLLLLLPHRPPPPPSLPHRLPVLAPTTARPAAGSDAALRPAPVRLVIRHSEGDAVAERRARELQGRLEAHRKFDVEMHPVAESVSADNLRIFFESDRLEARITRDLLESGPIPIRDFSDLRPRPRSGTIELWLAATPSSGIPTPYPAAIEVQRPPATPAESATPAARRPEPASPSTAPARSVSETLRLLLLRPGN